MLVTRLKANHDPPLFCRVHFQKRTYEGIGINELEDRSLKI